MKYKRVPFLTKALKSTVALASIFAILFIIEGCDKDDPTPVNEEEVITTITVTLVPVGGGNTIELRYYDEDGDNGSASPEITVGGPVLTNTSYTAQIELLNETKSPAENVTQEIIDESNDHLFCFETSSNVSIAYLDEDENGLPLGVVSLLTATAPGQGTIGVILRHQPGTKTGECPGSGESDLDIEFNVSIQ